MRNQLSSAPISGERAYLEMGRRERGDLLESGTAPSAADIVSAVAANHELRAEVERLKAERGRMLEMQRQVMDLLGAPSPEKIVHALRNLLNDRELLKSLAESSCQL